MGQVRNITNDQLLRMSYNDPKNIRHFLKSWSVLESLGEKGDTVATCILIDLKTVTGIDMEKYNRHNRRAFNELYKNGVLSHYQYMAIAYTLVLGYSQEDVAYVMGVEQPVITTCINRGIKRIQQSLGAFEEE